MKTKINVVRMFVILVLVFLWGGQLSAYAEKRAWAKFDSEVGSLTFYYGDKESLGADEYWGFEVTGGSRGWNSSAVKSVIFDNSFAEARPTSCRYWFYSCENLKSIIGIENLNTSEVIYMDNMFNSCSSLTSLDVSNFKTEKVESMYNMFNSCSSLTSLDVSNFKTDQVTNMHSMFSYCSKIKNLDLSNFNTEKVKRMSSMFNGCSSLTSLKVSKFNTAKVENMESMFCNCASLDSLHLSNFDTQNVTDMGSMFSGCASLKSLDISNFDTKNVTDMNSMFSGCAKLTSLDVSKLNTENVTNMGYMFKKCSSLTSIDVSKFNTANVRYMNFMFNGCSNLTSLNVSKFNTANVGYMNCMFDGCSKLTSLDVSNFDTKSATTMYSMFKGCSNLTSLDVSNFNTEKVRIMSSMFNGCSSLSSLDVSNFHTPKLEFMDSLFYDCSSLTSLDVSNFYIGKVEELRNWYTGCSSLKSIYIADMTDSRMVGIIKEFLGAIYCSPLQYFALKNNTTLSSKNIIPYVDINSAAEYGTLCVPIGSTLAESSYSGFDKLYTIKSADKDKGTITMEEATTIEPGVAYVYHRNLPEGDTESIITFSADMEESSAVTAPKNDDSLLKGTFSRITAPGGCYILQTDGNFHPVSADNTTLGVGAYRAYLDLSSLPGFDNTGDVEAKGYKMVFEDNQATAIDGISEQPNNQPKAYFDLMGRRVSTPKVGGLYIVNGKKVMYKN